MTTTMQSVLIENAEKTCRARFNSPEEALDQFRDDCGYDDPSDEPPLDYILRLEEYILELLDQLSREQEAERLRNE